MASYNKLECDIQGRIDNNWWRCWMLRVWREQLNPADSRTWGLLPPSPCSPTGHGLGAWGSLHHSPRDATAAAVLMCRSSQQRGQASVPNTVTRTRTLTQPAMRTGTGFSSMNMERCENSKTEAWGAMSHSSTSADQNWNLLMETSLHTYPLQIHKHTHSDGCLESSSVCNSIKAPVYRSLRYQHGLFECLKSMHGPQVHFLTTCLDLQSFQMQVSYSWASPAWS